MRPAILGGFVAVLIVAVPLAAQDPAPAPAPATAPAPPAAAPQAEPQVERMETLDLSVDRTQRMTVPVSIGGTGPYGFIVDTGSERTVISRELADRLRLEAGRAATVYSMTEASRIDTVVIPELAIGQRTISDIHAPALSRSNLGAEGMLGVDSLQSQRVELDFVNNAMTVTPAYRAPQTPWPADTIVVTARSRYGHLIIADASFDGEPIVVIVDTGAQVTVGNNALRQRLERRGRLGPLHPIDIISVTGGTIRAEYGIAERILIGNAGIRHMPVAFADAHPFRQLRLHRRPALLLGMDAMRLFDRVSFDFANKRVRFVVRGSALRAEPVEVAAR